MPSHEFFCTDCAVIQELTCSIKEDPPKNVPCPHCDQVMTKIYDNCYFVLKGTGWAGKDLKALEYASGETQDKTEQEISDRNRMSRISKEVLEVRRKGRKARDELIREKPQKWADYREARAKGVRHDE